MIQHDFLYRWAGEAWWHWAICTGLMGCGAAFILAMACIWVDLWKLRKQLKRLKNGIWDSAG